MMTKTSKEANDNNKAFGVFWTYLSTSLDHLIYDLLNTNLNENALGLASLNMPSGAIKSIIELKKSDDEEEHFN